MLDEPIEDEDISEITQGAKETDTMLIPQYRVMVHNDDVTPMDFVIMVLNRFFQKDNEAAREIMIEAHKSGVALVAIMPLERAEFKVEKAHDYSRSHDYPLTFSIEPVN